MVNWEAESCEANLRFSHNGASNVEGEDKISRVQIKNKNDC